MKRALGTLVVLLALTLPASATTIVKSGSSADGWANPGGCVIQPEGSELHVNCRHSDGRPARIRYRYLGHVHGPAEFTAVIERHGGECGPGSVRWMDPTPRTGRVIVDDCYVHIVSVEWVR